MIARIQDMRAEEHDSEPGTSATARGAARGSDAGGGA
jgi:hypothetical protein